MGNPYVTVVSGLPRSGTSMMMQMLAAGGMSVLIDGARAPDPDNPRGYFEYEPATRTAHDPGWVDAAAGKAVKVVHLLLPNLPSGREYRVLFMQRDMDEVLTSQAAMLERLNRTGAEMSRARLAEVFAGQLRRVRAWVADQPHFSAIDVEYRQVVENPAGQAARVNRFLNGTLDESAMAAAVDPALYRRRH